MVDAPCLERVILWEEDAYSLVPCKIKIGCALVLRAIGYLNPILHVLQIGDQLITNGESLFKTTVDSDGTLWKKKIDLIKCVRSTIKKLVFYGFCGGDSDLSFLKSILRSANMLRDIYIVFSDAVFSTGMETEMNEKLKGAVASVELANANVQIFRVPKHNTWNYKTTSDLLLSDPFDCLM
ncbi:hypothetical protein D1007_37815 [Hordeum vulgare]|nr:hypothetical protein D1007_37815 [Hordeum vulgare]